jgi:hypothetical protein
MFLCSRRLLGIIFPANITNKEIRGFKKMATFPFGWLRGIEDDNWQILWDSQTRILYVKGALSKRVIDLGQPSTWQEAKSLADRVRSEPELYIDL